MKKLTMAAIAVALLTVCGMAGAHSGGTDAQGCHIDHKTGIRHCH
ncbi:YHYH domain-containing protein [Ralstonia solanacearum]|nr:YHYH domain-containing protein [Ralstonia solanacearum]